MSESIPISELKQRTGKVLSKAVVDRQDVVIERYGQEYAVILSLDRYQQLLDAARARVRERLLTAQQEIQAKTADIPPQELDELIAEAIKESRRERAGLNDAGHT